MPSRPSPYNAQKTSLVIYFSTRQEVKLRVPLCPGTKQSFSRSERIFPGHPAGGPHNPAKVGWLHPGRTSPPVGKPPFNQDHLFEQHGNTAVPDLHLWLSQDFRPVRRPHHTSRGTATAPAHVRPFHRGVSPALLLPHMGGPWRLSRLEPLDGPGSVRRPRRPVVLARQPLSHPPPAGRLQLYIFHILHYRDLAGGQI